MQIKIELINMFYTSMLFFKIMKHVAEFSFHSFNFSSKHSFIHENLSSSSFSSTIKLVPTVVMEQQHSWTHFQSCTFFKSIKFFTVHLTCFLQFFQLIFHNTCKEILGFSMLQLQQQFMYLFHFPLQEHLWCASQYS